MIELSGIAEMHGVKETPDGIEIGALTNINEIERNPLINKSYKLLAEAASKVASPQIRNTGTIGGNVSRTRAAGTIAPACPATGPAATPASPTRRKGRIASTPSSTPTAAWRCRNPTWRLP